MDLSTALCSALVETGSSLQSTGLAFSYTLLKRTVFRLPPEILQRLDRLAARASLELRIPIPRSAIVRLLIHYGLEVAEQREDFAADLGQALVKRGRRAGLPNTPRERR